MQQGISQYPQNIGEEKYMQRTYALTVFEQSGEKLLDESFTAKNDDEAKEIGQARLKEEGHSDRTHRCVSPEAKLILFHR
jgi:hypothetical protein